MVTLCATDIGSAQKAPPLPALPALPAQVARGPVMTDESIVIPAATLASVQLATQKLADQNLKGNYAYAIENMYPRYKKKQEKTLGTMINAQEVQTKIANGLNQMGVTITSYTVGKPVGVFKVWQQIKPELKMKIDQGIDVKLKDSDVFSNWLIFIPTTQVWTFTNNKSGVPRKLKRESYQIAVAQEIGVQGQEKWTFIDGSKMTTQDLRSVFPSLPSRLLLPESKDSEIK